MIAFDANLWIVRFDPALRVPVDPSTGLEIDHAQLRVKHLISEAAKARQVLLIPTPVLSEVMIFTDARRFEMLAQINSSANLQVAPFDTKAAIELAEMNLEIAKADKKFGSEAPYQKTKIDRHIVAICKANGCEVLFTTDRSLGNFATRFGLGVRHLADIPLPDDKRQLDLFPSSET